MLFGDFLYSESEALVVLLLFLVLLVAGEFGYQYGRRRRTSTDESTRTQALAIQGAILGLLGLLLGFTFAMAVSRFDTRKQRVVDEANAIGTAYLRARLLPEPEKTEATHLLRQYIDARLEAAQGGSGERTASLQDLLWSRAGAVMAKDSRAIAAGLFVQSVNDVIDMAGKSEAALNDHVPESVLFLLYFIAAVSVGVVGYGCGLGNARTLFAMVALSALISLVVLIIVDLDRPRRGLVRVSERSMIELKQSVEGTKP